MDRLLTEQEILKIKSDLINLFRSGNAPEDLREHLLELGLSSPEGLPTGPYRAGVDRLSSGHWRMIADKWLSGIPGEPSSLESDDLEDALEKIEALIQMLRNRR